MSNLIETTFNNLRKNKKKALIPFITANYPNRMEFIRLLHKLPDYGATMVEIGIPFSDPMADGIVIQKTSEQAIKNGFTIIQLIKDISEFKKIHKNVPIIIMSYANPIMQFGVEAFINKTETAGLDGLLLVDVPPDQHQTVIKETTSISMIRLVTATTDIDRLKNIQNNASGFIYYVSVKGTTGTQVPNYKTVEEHLNIIKKQIHLPTVIGFGISNEKVANEMASISDGVIIGSSFLKPFLYAKEEDYTKIGNEQLNFIHSIEKKINTK